MENPIVACPSCGARNRKNLLKAGDHPVCGKCGQPLPAGGGPVAVSESDFEAVLKASPVPVLVDFWAAWCAPCRAFAPVLEKYAQRHVNEVLTVKVDTEANPRLAARYQIQSIPTVALFRGASEIARQPGAMPAQALEEWVRRSVGG